MQKRFNPMKTIVTHCKLDSCKKMFSASLREVNRGNGKFCSKECCLEFIRLKRCKPKTPNCICSTCKKGMYRTPSKKKNSKRGHLFCSRLCKEEAQRLDSDNRIEAIMPPHYGTNSKEYRAIAFRHKNAECESCGYDRYEDVLEVHHIDHDRQNNSVSNLKILCPTCHQEEHFLSKSGRFGPRAKHEHIPV
jgi:5-methylcytosine-specific restriction endonuclease McrA